MRHCRTSTGGCSRACVIVVSRKRTERPTYREFRQHNSMRSLYVDCELLRCHSPHSFLLQSVNNASCNGLRSVDLIQLHSAVYSICSDNTVLRGRNSVMSACKDTFRIYFRVVLLTRCGGTCFDHMTRRMRP